MLNQSFKIGDILYATWGYGQTNVDFYQVINLVGAFTLELRELNQEEIEQKPRSFCGYTTPIFNNFRDIPFKVRIRKNGNIQINGRVRPWSGEPVYFSSYA